MTFLVQCDFMQHHNLSELDVQFSEEEVLDVQFPWTRLQGRMDSQGGFISPAGALLRGMC